MLPEKAHYARGTSLRLKVPRRRSVRLDIRTRATLDERAERFDATFNLRDECHGVCCINKGPFGERRVPIYDNKLQQMVWADIIGHPDPDHVGFSSTVSQLWTLDMRLASNGVKIGDIVVRVSSSSERGAVDLMVRFKHLPLYAMLIPFIYFVGSDYTDASH